jgi:hypothetical protein
LSCRKPRSIVIGRQPINPQKGASDGVQKLLRTIRNVFQGNQTVARPYG